MAQFPKALAPIALLIMGSLGLGCATTPQDAAQKQLPDQSFQQKGSTFSGQYGLDSNSKMIIRTTTPAEDELAVLEVSNTFQKDAAQRTSFDLERCRADLSDKRLGGTGRLPDPGPDVARLQVPEPTEQLGMTEAGQPVVVREQGFADRLLAEKRLSSQLKAARESAERSLSLCTHDLAEARRAHGIQGKPYTAEGYRTQSGTWVSNKHGESDLDDAFEIGAQH